MGMLRLGHASLLIRSRKARDMVFISFGWVIRHLMNVRDNYFGNFTHFSTLTEYVTKRNKGMPVGDPVEWKWREGKVRQFLSWAFGVLKPSLPVQYFRSVVERSDGALGDRISCRLPRLRVLP